MFEFNILGNLEARRAGVPLPVTAAKQRIVLTALLTRPGRAVTTAELTDLVWAEQPPPTSRNTLQAHIARLRRALRAPDLIETSAHGYFVRSESFQLDVDRFDDLTRQGRAALTAGHASLASSLLQEGLALWRGPALADVPASSLQRELVPAYEERRLVAWELFLSTELRLGRAEEHLGTLHRLTTAHPLREELWLLWIRALERCRRRAEALARYHELTEILRDELGTEPNAKLRDAHQRLIRTETGAGPRPTHLPPATPELLGRDWDSVELAAHLRAEPAPTTVLWGLPGVGKTALAAQFANRIRGRYPDGAFFVDVAGYADRPPAEPGQVAAQLLRALGVTPEDRPRHGGEQIALVRALLSGKRALLVFDNVVGAEQVAALLPGGGPAGVLITSRGPLPELTAFHGARQHRLRMLDERAAVALIEQFVGGERARAEPRAIREVARLCDYLPLALRVAATNIAADPHVPVSDTVACLRRHGLSRLCLGRDQVPVVREAIARSWVKLSRADQQVLIRLSSLPGESFPAEATAIPADEVTAALYRLTSHGLLERISTGEHRLPRLIRAFVTGERELVSPLHHCATDR